MLPPFGVSYTGSTPALGAGRRSSILRTPTEYLVGSPKENRLDAAQFSASQVTY
jgi:hypothetical protein